MSGPAHRRSVLAALLAVAPPTAVAALVAVAATTGTASAATPAPLTTSLITEYPIPVLDQQPLQIATGTSNNLIFSQGATSALGSSTVGGTITQTPGLSAPADGIVADDGSTWVTQPSANEIGRITSAGTVTEYPIKTGSKPEGITVGPDGNIWFTEAGVPAQIGRITPTGTITYFSSGLNPSDAPTSITSGPDGNLWFTAEGNHGKIGRITTSGTITEYTSGLTQNSDPLSIAAGPDHNLWFTESTSPGAIGRITTSGTITQFTTGLSANSVPTSITEGPDDNLWFTDAGAPGRIGQITTSGTITEAVTPTVGSVPDGITTGPDGRIWFTESGLAGGIGAIDPWVQSSGSTSTPPAVTTAAATTVGQTSATLNGTVNPEGSLTSYYFSWGTSTSYGHSAFSGIGFVGFDSTTHQEPVTITGLTAGTTYHYRLVATNCLGCQSGTTDGSDMTFTTEAANTPGSTGKTGTTTTTTTTPTTTTTTTGTTGTSPSGTTPPTGTPATPTPQIGHTAVAQVSSGTVLVSDPTTGAERPLIPGVAIPIGAVIDASHGVLRVTTALAGPKKSQTATVWGGSFTLMQNRRTGFVTFVLTGPNCTRAASERTAIRSRAAQSSTPKPDSLWAHDNHGRYSTRGYDSVATVRGTWWETENTCAGTLTYVKRGLVSVRDVRRHITVLVPAGQSYLARS
jgi:streptogramin lyase